MIQENETFSGEESLQLISSMINRAKNRFSETGTLYLLWGWVIFICCATQFILQYFFKSPYAYYIWFLSWAALIYQVIFLAKKKKNAKVRTYTGEILGYVWLTFTVCIFITVFILEIQKAYPSINAVILVLYGVPTFLSGKILKFPALATGGICCWLLAIVTPFVPLEFQQLLLAAAVVVAWIIPGYLLRSKFKKEN